MKKVFPLGFVFLAILLLASCSSPPTVSLKEVIQESTTIEKGMDREQVLSILKKKPDTIEKFDNMELWIYEGIICNELSQSKRYENLTIKFVDGKVTYVGFFSCKLPKQ